MATLVPRDARFLGSAPARPLLLCGQQSLEIFCLGILLSALGHFILSEYSSAIAVQLAVNAAGITAMLLTAAMINWYKAMDRMPMLEPAAGRPGGGVGGGGRPQRERGPTSRRRCGVNESCGGAAQVRRTPGGQRAVRAP